MALPDGYAIRPYREADAAALADAEARAGRLFAAHGFAELAETPAMAPDAFHARATAGETLVCAHRGDGPVAFAITGPVGPFLHLMELSVDPAHGRQGIGAALLDAVVARSVDAGLAGVSLSTFRDVPFNAPFYARHGFLPCAPGEAPAATRARFLLEIPPGIAPETRLIMLRRNSESAGGKA